MIDLTDLIEQNRKSIFSSISTGSIKLEDQVIVPSPPEATHYEDVNNTNINIASIKTNNTIISIPDNPLLKNDSITGALGNASSGSSGNTVNWGNIPEQVPYNNVNNTNSNGENSLKQGSNIDYSNNIASGEKNEIDVDNTGFLKITANTDNNPNFNQQLLAGIANVTDGVFGSNNTYGLPVQNQTEIKSEKSKFEENINFLVNNSKAYLSSAYISSVIGAGSPLGIASSIATSLLNALSARQYWTADEFAKITASNYDTLSSGSSDNEMTIKDFLGVGLNGVGNSFSPMTSTTVNPVYTQNENTNQWSIDNNIAVPVADIKNFEYEIKYPIDTDLQKMINTLSQKSSTIGYMYIHPINPTVTENYSPFKIPFEFNPTINESSIEARYSAVQLLSRIGDLRAYVGTSPLTVTIKTDYLITTDSIGTYHKINATSDTGLDLGSAVPSTYKNSKTGSNSSGATGTDDHYAKWMDYYDEDVINGIEMAYRSLILPDFSASSSNNITYVRPPIIKVIMSNELNTNEYVGGETYELAYPIFNANDGGNPYNSRNVLASQNKAKFPYHKSFIVTGITINKNFETNNAYYDSDGSLRFNGFSVEMTLAEVTQAYTDIMPDFSVYQQRFSQYNGFGKVGSDALFQVAE
jgi:hypothetical protein